mgnify:CR=1 FL=1
MRWDCEFTYVSFTLSAENFALLLICSYYLFKLLTTLPSSKRRPQKLFLVLSIIHETSELFAISAVDATNRLFSFFAGSSASSLFRALATAVPDDS